MELDNIYSSEEEKLLKIIGEAYIGLEEGDDDEYWDKKLNQAVQEYYKTYHDGLPKGSDNDIYFDIILDDIQDIDESVDLVTRKELGRDIYYRTLLKNNQEVKKYNFHSDYWGSANGYQSTALQVMKILKDYIGEVVYITDDEKAKIEGLLVDDQYNSHLDILIEPVDENNIQENYRRLNESKQPSPFWKEVRDADGDAEKQLRLLIPILESSIEYMKEFDEENKDEIKEGITEHMDLGQALDGHLENILSDIDYDTLIDFDSKYKDIGWFDNLRDLLEYINDDLPDNPKYKVKSRQDVIIYIDALKNQLDYDEIYKITMENIDDYISSLDKNNMQENYRRRLK